MHVKINDVTNYACDVVNLVDNFVEDKIWGFPQFNEYIKEGAETLQNDIKKKTKEFFEKLEIVSKEKLQRKLPYANLHHEIVNYLLRGEIPKEQSEPEKSLDDSIKVEGMLSRIQEIFLEDVCLYGDIYFPLVKKNIEESIRKYRPDIFKILNPTQKTLH